MNLPGSQPATVTVPRAIDELDYDSIHQRVYIGNTTAPFFLTGIDLTGVNANTVTASIPLPGSAEQPRFNPVDGLIYLTIPSVGVLVFDPTAGTAGTGDLMTTYAISGCSGNGNWIGPITNTMLVGCNNVGGQALINLADWIGGQAISAGDPRRRNGFQSRQSTLVLRFRQQCERRR